MSTVHIHHGPLNTHCQPHQNKAPASIRRYILRSYPLWQSWKIESTNVLFAVKVMRRFILFIMHSALTMPSHFVKLANLEGLIGDYIIDRRETEKPCQVKLLSISETYKVCKTSDRNHSFLQRDGEQLFEGVRCGTHKHLCTVSA